MFGFIPQVRWEMMELFVITIKHFVKDMFVIVML